MSFNNATICLNGHVISKFQSNYQEYCSQCGAKTYSNCGHCNSPIHGVTEIKGAVVLGERPYTKPNYCYKCGKPYPWTEKILNNAIELLALDDELDDSTKQLIKTAIPDLLVETPSTPLAVAKYQKGISNAGQILKNSLRSLLIDVLSETVKKSLFP